MLNFKEQRQRDIIKTFLNTNEFAEDVCINCGVVVPAHFTDEDGDKIIENGDSVLVKKMYVQCIPELDWICANSTIDIDGMQYIVKDVQKVYGMYEIIIQRNGF